jgi:hypothetical protein
LYIKRNPVNTQTWQLSISLIHIYISIRKHPIHKNNKNTTMNKKKKYIKAIFTT